MKGKLLALFVFLSGIATAQCDAGFTWSFDSATDTLSLTANADNFGYIDRWYVKDTITNAGAESYFNLNTFKVCIPYGVYTFYITHVIASGNGNVCFERDTVYIDNTAGDICDPTFLTQVDYIVPYTTLYGVNHPDLSHIWIYGNDTISTNYICTLNRLINFSITHIISDNGSCQQEETDTIIASYYNEQECAAWFIYNLTNNPNEFELYSVTGNLYNHIWVIDGDTVGDGDFIFNHLFEWGGPHTVCLTVYNDYCADTWCDQIIAAGTEDMPWAMGSIYPNPTNGNLFVPVNAKQAQNLSFIIYNLLGQPVLSQNSAVNIGNQTIELSTESLPQGVYVLQIADKNTGSVFTKKIVKN